MKDYIEQRVRKVAEYMVESHGTVRQAAAKYHISKSTVHKDMTERLKEIDYDLWENVRAVLDVNKLERHIRGGMATRDKYKALNKKAV